MTEFEIEGIQYRCGKLPVLTQFNVLTRSGPMVSAFLAFLEKAHNGETLAGAIGPAMKAMSGMSIEDTAYVFAECLGTVQRQNDKSWSGIWNKQAGRALFDDMELQIIVQVLLQVFMENYTGFFPLLAQASREAGQA